jgi:hypothetical protein
MRIQDIQIRRSDREQKKQERLAKIEENRLRDERKEGFRKEYMDSLEQGKVYVEDEFEEFWIRDNPEIEIPPEVQDEDDLDLENETQNN